MATAIVTASPEKALNLARNWAKAKKFKIAEATGTRCKSGEAVSETARFMAKRRILVSEWSFAETPRGTSVRIYVRPAWYVSLGLLAFEYLGVGLAFSALFDRNGEVFFSSLEKILLGAVIFGTLMLCTRWLDSMLRSIENLFWNRIQRFYDIVLLTRIQGRLGRGWELLMSFGQICFCCVSVAALFGMTGFTVVFVLLAPIFLFQVLNIQLSEIPQWDWRLWVINNVMRWTWLVVVVIGIVFLLAFLEGAMAGISENNYESVRNPYEWLGQHRRISPPTAAVLESDAKRHMKEWAKACVGNPENVREEFLSFLRRILPKVSSAIFLAMILGVTAFAYKFSVGGLIKSARLWREESRGYDWRRGPFVPALPEAWKWKNRGVATLIVLQWAFGGVINIIAGAFAIESLIYMLTGHTALRAESAYLWSWIFAWSDMLFGDRIGRTVASAEVMLLAFPFLLCCLMLAYRITCLFSLCVTVLAKGVGSVLRKSQQLKSVRSLVHELCLRSGLNTPVVLLNNKDEFRMRIGRLPVIGIGFLELSRGVVDLLDPEELKAVIAHELGHLKHGFFVISLSKIMSLLALFPNYYLTLCINWAKREMDADKFALQYTGNPDALHRALIKMSAAELWNRPITSARRVLEKVEIWKWLRPVLERMEELIAAGKFFFGEDLLGYTHPSLSERLAAVDAFEGKQAGHEVK